MAKHGFSYFGLGLGLATTLNAAFAQSAAPLSGAASFGDWRFDAPGVLRKITTGDLLKPLSSEPAAARSEVVKRPDGATLKTPPRFLG